MVENTEHTLVVSRKKGLDFSHIGPENDGWLRSWMHGMDQVRVDIDYASLKNSFVAWAKMNRILDELPHWEQLPVHHYATIGKMTFLVQHGAAMPVEAEDWFNRQIEAMLKIQVEVEDELKEPPLTHNQRRTIEYATLYSMIDAIWYRFRDNNDEIEDRVKKLLDKAKPNQAMLKRLYDHFKESFNNALNEKDNTLVQETVEPILTVVNVLAVSSGNAKAVRDSKGVTNRSIKQAKNAKYKSVDMNTDVFSISPAMIPGGTGALVYNAKTRKLSIYVGTQSNLGIKGTKITGYDESLSFCKILRKPKQVLATLRDATQKRVDIIMNDHVKGKKHAVNGKLSKDTLILRVFK